VTPRQLADNDHHPDCGCTRCEPPPAAAPRQPTRGARAFGAFVGLCVTAVVALTTTWLCVLLVSAIGRAW
jgi:hypothetical protein